MLYLASGMCIRTAAKALYGALAILLVALSSCDVGTSLYTEEELDRLFDVRITHEGAALAQGARLSAGHALEASVKSDSDSRLAASLELHLTNADGIEAASIRFSTAGQAGSVAVTSITKDLPPFTLPDDLADGYYSLTSIIKDGAGATLSTSTIVVLVYDGRLEAPVLAAYPGGAVPGRVSMLRIGGTFPAGLDPWIRWIVDGSERDAGPLSERHDLFAWKAPEANGIYTVKVEVFPFRPPVGMKTPAVAKAEIRIPVSQAAPAKDEAWALFRLDGSLGDSGLRPAAEPIKVLGKPYLETYATGYGYVLGKGSGLASETPLVPLDDSAARALPFTASFTLAPLPGSGDAPASGRLLSLDSPAGSLIMGLDDGKPYLALGAGQTLLADALIDARDGGLVRLAFSVDEGAVRFYVNDKPVGEGSLPPAALDLASAGWRLAGDGGFPAIYDEVRVQAGPWPAHRLSEASAKGKSLVAASGFEGGLLGIGLEVSGGVALAHGRASLEPGAALRLGKEGLPKRGIALTLSIREGLAAAVVQLEDGTSLSLGSDGSLRLGETLALPVSGKAPSTGSASASIEVLSDGLRVTGFDGRRYLAAGARLSPTARLAVLNAGEAPLVLGSASAYEPPLGPAAGGSKGPDAPRVAGLEPSTAKP